MRIAVVLGVINGAVIDGDVIDGVNDREALFADVLLAAPEARLLLHPPVWGGIVWRIGARAYRLYLTGLTELDAAAAHAWGIVDAVTDDPDAWLAGRSELALASAAALIARRGGDVAERAEFARLFASGEPQEGMGAFLEKRRPVRRLNHLLRIGPEGTFELRIANSESRKARRLHS